MPRKDAVVISGVGVQCHAPACVVKNERVKDVLHLHSSPAGGGIDFWKGMEAIRKDPYIWLPEADNNNKLVVVSAQQKAKHLDIEMLGILRAEMIRKGFFGWMTPGGILILRRPRKAHAFNRVCVSLGLNALLEK